MGRKRGTRQGWRRPLCLSHSPTACDSARLAHAGATSPAGERTSGCAVYLPRRHRISTRPVAGLRVTSGANIQPAQEAATAADVQVEFFRARSKAANRNALCARAEALCGALPRANAPSNACGPIRTLARRLRRPRTSRRCSRILHHPTERCRSAPNPKTKHSSHASRQENPR